MEFPRVVNVELKTSLANSQSLNVSQTSKQVSIKVAENSTGLELIRPSSAARDSEEKFSNFSSDEDESKARYSWLKKGKVCAVTIGVLRSLTKRLSRKTPSAVDDVVPDKVEKGWGSVYAVVKATSSKLG
ncbi:hypothetical protein CROQUDRAFT_650331, partial [Cronartium quercuum f. sp. fusiforme G11]